MKRKDITLIALEALLTLMCATSMALLAHESYGFAIPLFLLTLCSIALLWTSWKYIEGSYAPKLRAKEGEDVDEIVFSMPSSEKEYLKKTLYHVPAIRPKTWFLICLNLYLLVLFIVFPPVVQLIQLFLLLRWNKNIRTTFKERYSNYKKANLLIIFNKNGMYGAIPRLSTEEGKSMIYLYTAFNDWSAISSIVFYRKHIEVNYGNKQKEYLIPDNDKQLSDFKKMVGKYFPKAQQPEKILNLQNYTDIFNGICTPAIGIGTEENNTFHLGESYIAPIPSVPKNFRWPTNHQLPLSFLMQINCKDLAPFDVEGLLPKEGMLYFFYEMKEMLLNDWGNNGCARVVYSSVKNDQLVFAKDPIKDIDQNYLLRQRKISFHKKNDIPGYADACQLVKSVALTNKETYNYTRWRFKKDRREEQKKFEEMAQLFGYANYHTLRELEVENPADMLLLMQITLTKDDFYAYYLYHNNNSEKGAECRAFFEQWEELPCQLYFFIPRNDLKRLDFSRIYFARRGKRINSFTLPDDII